MAKLLPFLSATLSAALLGACVLPPAAGPGAADSETQLSARRPGQILPGRGAELPGANGGSLIGQAGGNIIAAGGGNLVEQTTAGLVAQAGAALSGTVKAPAGIIATGGGNLIGQAGGNLIGQAGGNMTAVGYALLATVEQAPVAGRPVFLMDAAGKVVTGEDGKPLTALTDGQGRYSFEGFVTTRHLIAAVELHEGRSLVQAVLPRGDAKGRTLDMDLVSTLTTAYIRDRYVSGQPDPVATLDKLPAEVERETRDQAARALAAADMEAPATLEPAALVAMVDGLRQRDPAFHQQMETVQKLLIAAGQSDMGSGRLASEVSLEPINDLQVQPDGTLLIAAGNRLWRLGPDGKLVTEAGRGTAEEGSLDGKLRQEAGYNTINRLDADEQGRVLITERHRLTRLRPDGRVEQLPAISDLHGLAAFGGRIHFVGIPWTASVYNPEYSLGIWSFAEGDKPTRALAVEREDWNRNWSVKLRRAGHDGQRAMFLGWADGDHAWIKRFDVVDKRLETVLDTRTDGLLGLSVDRHGNAFMLDGQRALKVRKPDGSTITLLDRLPEDRQLAMSPVELTPGGQAFVAFERQAFQVRERALALVAGKPGTAVPEGGPAQEVSLQAPAGLAFDSGGAMVVADGHRLLRVGSDNAVTVLAGTGEEGFSGDGGPARQARLGKLAHVRVDGGGRVYVLDRADKERIRAVDGAGTIRTLFETEEVLSDFVVEPSGRVLAALTERTEYEGTRLVAIENGQVAEVTPKRYGLRYLTLALGPDGALYAYNLSYSTLLKLNGSAFDTAMEATGLTGELTSMVADGKGRFYLSQYAALQNKTTIHRWTPATGETEALAGTGGRLLNGEGVDDSLLGRAYMVFSASGDMLISDSGHKQVKRLEAAEL